MLIGTDNADELGQNFLWHKIGSSPMNLTIFHSLDPYYVANKRVLMSPYDYVDEVLDTRVMMHLYDIIRFGRRTGELCL